MLRMSNTDSRRLIHSGLAMCLFPLTITLRGCTPPLLLLSRRSMETVVVGPLRSMSLETFMTKNAGFAFLICRLSWLTE